MQNPRATSGRGLKAFESNDQSLNLPEKLALKFFDPADIKNIEREIVGNYGQPREKNACQLEYGT